MWRIYGPPAPGTHARSGGAGGGRPRFNPHPPLGPPAPQTCNCPACDHRLPLLSSMPRPALCLGGLPVASACPVLLCAMRAALPLSMPSRLSASYTLSTFVPLGMSASKPVQHVHHKEHCRHDHQCAACSDRPSDQHLDACLSPGVVAGH